MTKPELERMVFAEFARALSIPTDSIESRPEPEPDILCLVAGTAHYFELTRGADQTAEQQIAEYEKASDKLGNLGYMGVPINLYSGIASTLRKKLTNKTYSTPHADRTSLLVYVEWSVERYLMHRLNEETWLKDAVEQGPFAEVWFYDRGYGVPGAI